MCEICVVVLEEMDYDVFKGYVVMCEICVVFYVFVGFDYF